MNDGNPLNHPAKMLGTEALIEVPPRSTIKQTRWRFTFLGLGIGIPLIVVKSLTWIPDFFKAWLPHVPKIWVDLVIELVGHVGIGFIVSALAVIAYEWGSEANAALTLSEELERVLASTASQAVVRGARTLLDKNVNSFSGLVRSLLIAGTVSRDNSWYVPAYLRFLAASCDSTHTIFSSINTFLRNQPDLPGVLETKSVLQFAQPADLIDQLLAGLLDGLRNGDQYYAVSNAQIWDTLPHFHAAHATAIKRKVKIRRVFVLFDPSDLALSAGDSLEIIYEHFRETQRLRPAHGYEMRIVANREAYKTLAPWPEQQHVHFGIFRPRRGDSVEVAAQTADQVHLELTRTLPARYFETFETLWNSLPAATDADVRFTLRAERMRRLPLGGRYRGISNIQDWTKPELKRFHDATLARVQSTNIQVERIFVYDEHSTSDLVSFLSDHHRRIAAGSMKGRYEWRFHAATPDSPTIPTTVSDHIPFGTFSQIDMEAGQTLSEVYSKKHEFLFQRGDSEVIISAFDDLWRQLDTKVELARRLTPEQVQAIGLQDS